jgi:WD40 repeat protein
MDGTVRVWDADLGTLTLALSGHADKVYAVAASPDGKRILSGAKNHELRLWDLGSGRCLRVLEGHEGVVRGVAFLPDGRFALSAGEDKTVRLWDLGTGRCGHGVSVPRCVSRRAPMAAAWRRTPDRKVLVWDVNLRPDPAMTALSASPAP